MRRLLTVALCIFFLTGCARTEYHKRPAPEAVSRPFPADFSWPARGELLAGFGSEDRGAPAKGLVIRTAPGQAIAAAHDGRVAFVHEAMPGYGAIVIVEHAEGYSTVYGRNAGVLVKAGQAVKRGEAIARSGPAGSSELYFEIRKNSRPLDPAALLPAA